MKGFSVIDGAAYIASTLMRRAALYVSVATPFTSKDRHPDAFGAQRRLLRPEARGQSSLEDHRRYAVDGCSARHEQA